jgi:ABC-2 type transport system permease protein
VFWLHVPHGLQEVFYSVANSAQRPHKIYTGYVRRLLVTALPFAVVISFPVQALFEGPSVGLVLHTAAVVVGMFLFLLWLWRRALRSYVSASS